MCFRIRARSMNFHTISPNKPSSGSAAIYVIVIMSMTALMGLAAINLSFKYVSLKYKNFDNYKYIIKLSSYGKLTEDRLRAKFKNEAFDEYLNYLRPISIKNIKLKHENKPGTKLIKANTFAEFFSGTTRDIVFINSLARTDTYEKYNIVKEPYNFRKIVHKSPEHLYYAFRLKIIDDTDKNFVLNLDIIMNIPKVEAETDEYIAYSDNSAIWRKYEPEIFIIKKGNI